MEGFQRGYDLENHLDPSGEVRRAVLWLDCYIKDFSVFLPIFNGSDAILYYSLFNRGHWTYMSMHERDSLFFL